MSKKWCGARCGGMDRIDRMVGLLHIRANFGDLGRSDSKIPWTVIDDTSEPERARHLLGPSRSHAADA